MIPNPTARRLHCPFDCAFRYDDAGPKIPDGYAWDPVAVLRAHNAEVEEVLKAHLDADHPGWTLEAVEAASVARRVEAVFEAGP